MASAGRHHWSGLQKAVTGGVDRSLSVNLTNPASLLTDRHEALADWFDLSKLQHFECSIDWPRDPNSADIVSLKTSAVQMLALLPSGLHSLGNSYPAWPQGLDGRVVAPTEISSGPARLTDVRSLKLLLPWPSAGFQAFPPALLHALSSIRQVSVHLHLMDFVYPRPHVTFAAPETIVLRLTYSPTPRSLFKHVSLLIRSAPDRFPSLRTVVIESDLTDRNQRSQTVASFDYRATRTPLDLDEGAPELRSLGLALASSDGIVWREEWDER